MVTQGWCLLDPTYKERFYDIREANSINEILDEEHKKWEGTLDSGRVVAKIYELHFAIQRTYKTNSRAQIIF